MVFDNLVAGEQMTATTTNLPDLVQPTWDQLMNGSLDTRYVEVQGMVSSETNRPDGWSVLLLHTKNGYLKVKVLQGELKGERYQYALVRIQGRLGADRDKSTGRVVPGQIRMSDVKFIVDQPAPIDMFVAPKKSAVQLTHPDPDYYSFRWVKVSGQVIAVRGRDYFMMDGAHGLRFVADAPLKLEAGDLVEVVGYQASLSADAPVLRGAMARKTGQSPLPEPRRLLPDDLPNRAFDSTWVRVDGVLTGNKVIKSELVLEMRSGDWRYWVRLHVGKKAPPPLLLGSWLELTGTYRAQGEYKILGPDVAAIDLLLNSPSDIKVIQKPSWWTLRRLLILVGVLLGVMAAAALWIGQLHRQVRQRTAELAAESRERQLIENHHAIEQERARIAQDLHDELGSGITEIDMLAIRVKDLCKPDVIRDGYLNEMCTRTREMVEVLDEIVWAMDSDHNSLDSLVSYFSIYADRFLKLANISLHLEQPAVALDLKLDSRRRHQLFLVFKEALNNVVRHSAATDFWLKIVVADAEVQLIMVDNGRGLPAGTPTGEISGLANMSSRIEKLGGRFEIISPSEGGTTVRFCVPVS
jgi:signal transduction histidine kinase